MPSFHRLLPAILLSVPLAAQAVPQGPLAGTYEWTDRSTDEYGDRSLSVTLTPVEQGWQADFSAHFYWADRPQKAADHRYSGILTGDPAVGPLTGTVYDAKRKRFWQVAMTIADDGITGTATESKGYKTSGTFTVTPPVLD